MVFLETQIAQPASDILWHEKRRRHLLVRLRSVRALVKTERWMTTITPRPGFRNNKLAVHFAQHHRYHSKLGGSLRCSCHLGNRTSTDYH